MAAKPCIQDVLASVPKNVQVVAATKGRSIQEMKGAIDAGISILGENYVQEAEQKLRELPALKEKTKLHLIGHLQKNKVKRAVELFDMVQSVDSLSLAKEIAKRAASLEKPMDILIQVNIGRETQKSGCDPNKAVQLSIDISKLQSIRLKGLMAMAPEMKNPEDARPYFKAMKKLFEEIKNAKIPHVKMETLSMGMSHDYMIAIEEGATMVRLGSSLFGIRK